MQIPLRSLWSYWKPCKYLSHNHLKTCANTAQESQDRLEVMQIPFTEPQENMCKYRSGVSGPIGQFSRACADVKHANWNSLEVGIQSRRQYRFRSTQPACAEVFGLATLADRCLKNGGDAGKFHCVFSEKGFQAVACLIASPLSTVSACEFTSE